MTKEELYLSGLRLWKRMIRLAVETPERYFFSRPPDYPGEVEEVRGAYLSRLRGDVSSDYDFWNDFDTFWVDAHGRSSLDSYLWHAHGEDGGWGGKNPMDEAFAAAREYYKTKGVI